MMRILIRNNVLKNICPPLLWSLLSKFKTLLKRKVIIKYLADPKHQDLEMYWDPEFAETLENWGKDNTWNEIQMIMSSCSGKVLDIACGTGKTICLLNKFERIEVFGFDISDLLIEKAISKGISGVNLFVVDATETKFNDNEFDYSYSIGSLEHFTGEGIDKFISESSRYTKSTSYHMIPVSRSSTNEGWLRTNQSFFNNSEEWWQEKFENHYRHVISIPSKWEDEISVGRWFICYK